MNWREICIHCKKKRKYVSGCILATRACCLEEEE